MKKFLSFLGSRQFLAFLALCVVALVIWFIGPFISFGGLKPSPFKVFVRQTW